MILLSSTLKSMDEDQLVIENENVKNKKAKRQQRRARKQATQAKQRGHEAKRQRRKAHAVSRGHVVPQARLLRL